MKEIQQEYMKLWTCCHRASLKLNISLKCNLSSLFSLFCVCGKELLFNGISRRSGVVEKEGERNNLC